MSTATSTHTPRGQLDQPQVRAGLGEVALVTVVIALATPSGAATLTTLYNQRTRPARRGTPGGLAEQPLNPGGRCRTEVRMLVAGEVYQTGFDRPSTVL